MNESAGDLLLQANRLLREGRVEEAIVAHERLLAQDAARPDGWYNLAYLQRCARRFEEALASYQQALDRGVRGPEDVHVNRAAILSDHLQRTEAAEEELKKAVAANPRFVVAWLNLGTLYEDFGDVARARHAYQTALTIAPTNGRAIARLAAVDLFEGDAARSAPMLRAHLKRPDLASDDAAEIAFALGHALDAIGDYDAAFAAFAAANHASRDSAPAGSIRYDRAAQEGLIDRLIRAFPAPAPLVAGPGEPSPIFICGMFRSGSTLVEQILARHGQVTPGGEFETLPSLIHSHLQPYPESVQSLTAQRITDLRAAYLTELHALHPAADVLTDKRPDNFLHIGLIKTLFPDARIVHTKRNPLDNLLSIYFLHFDHNIAYGLDLDDAAHWYGQYRRLMRHWKSLYPDDIHDVDYDAVVRNPRPPIADLLSFCDLAWEEDCLATHAARNPVRTASVWQVRQPLHDKSSGRWRNYERHLGNLREALGHA